MEQTPVEFITIACFIAFWVLAVTVILIAGRRRQSMRDFRTKMTAQWKPALIAAILFVIGAGLGGGEIFNPYGVAVFCQVMVGLALARSIAGYEPLPVTRSIIHRERAWRSLGLALGIALLVAPLALMVGSFGLGMGRQLLGETNRTAEAARFLPSNKWLAFFALLSGGGIAEETVYRLVLLSLLWRLTRRRWLATILSAVVFGAYHLTPLNSMYRIFWEFPVSQLLASTLIGLVWGHVFVKRGYETAVLGHTLGDWIPLILFGAA